MHNDSRELQILQALQGVTTLRQVLLGIQKQPTAEYPYFSYFPIGCPQLIFHKQTPLYIPELKAVQSEFTISGQVNYPSHLYADGNVEMIVVVFQPYTLKAFLNLPISLLHNQEVSGYDLENKNLKQLAAQIFNCEDTNLCINLIEQWLLLQIADILTSKTAYNPKNNRCNNTTVRNARYLCY